MTAAGSPAIAAARRLYRERRERDRLLGGYASLMGEPAWDMLLHLLILEDDDALPAEREAGADMPPVAAIHWVAVLGKLGLVERRPTSHGQARAVRLSEAGRAMMERVMLGG